jgi:hypothetical protein
MTNPLLRGLVDLLRPSVHGLAYVRVRVWLKEHNVTDRDADGDAYDEPREE